MRFLIYNIAYGTGSPGSESRRLLTGHRYLAAPERPFRKISDFLAVKKPDVVGLLEADLGSLRTGGCNQVEILANHLGMIPYFERKYAPGSRLQKLPYWRDQGNGILLRSAADALQKEFLSCGTKRLILEVHYCGVRFLLVHLALGRAIRSRQIRDLAQRIRPGEPTVLAGDFNTFYGEEELHFLMRHTGLRSANATGHPTYPAWHPVKMLDHLLISPELEVVDFDVPHLFFSDHLPLVADLKLR